MHAANKELAFRNGKNNRNSKKREERRIEQCLMDLDTIGTPLTF